LKSESDEFDDATWAASLLQHLFADLSLSQHFPSVQLPFFLHCSAHSLASFPSQHLASAILLPAQHDLPSFASHLFLAQQLALSLKSALA
jgi:hypothetical protein